MALKLSCAFATSAESHEHARIAEDLGYAWAWFYNSPALYPDVWVQLCRAAERTRRIGLSPGVLVPSFAIRWSMQRRSRRWFQSPDPTALPSGLDRASRDA